MFSMHRRNSPRRHGGLAALLIITALARFATGCVLAKEVVREGVPVEVSPVVLTSFEQIWQAEPRAWHRIRLEYLVYYYDSLWMALWGRCGTTDGYLSLDHKSYHIRAGQKIRIEGLIQPGRGMTIDEASVTVIAEPATLEYVATAGYLGSTAQFDKRPVMMEGYVDRETPPDANHLDLLLIAEGRSVLAHVLLKSDEKSPQLTGSFVKAKGVYLARTEPDWVGPKIELWVQTPDDIVVTGALERDERFELVPTPLAQLARSPPRLLVHVVGTVEAQDPGKSLTLREGTATIVVQSPQSATLAVGGPGEAIGFPSRDGNHFILREALFRHPQSVLTTVAQVWNLPEAQRQRWRQVRLELIVYYFDPLWKTLWARSGESDEYLSLGAKAPPIHPGQRILVEGRVLPANGMVVEEAKVTILDGAVPLDFRSTQGAIGDTERFNKHLVQVEGYVDRQAAIDSRHLQLDMVVDGRLVIGRVLLPEQAKVPDWTGALLRIKGVYSATQDPTGSLPTLEVWSLGLDQSEVLGWLAEDKRFELPPTPIERITPSSAGQLVKVMGAVRSQLQGKTLTVRDETGQITLRTAMGRPMALGQMVEVIGYPVLDGTDLQLRDGLYRRSKLTPPPPPGGLPVLRLADQLRELQPEEAARSYPVHLTGVVTWARPNADFFYIRDVSGGVRIYRPPEVLGQLLMGRKVEVTGVSASGPFTPVVLAGHVESFSTVEMPEPRPVTLEQALTGVEEAQWVSMTGYVRAVEDDGPWARFELTTSAGEFQAMVPPNERWAGIPGSIVRVRGVCSALANTKRQLTGIQLWVASSRFVDVEQAAPADPFTVPMRAIASLRQFSSVDLMNRLVRVSGTVIHHSPGRLVHLQDGAEALLVLSRDTAPLVPGERIEAVGYPGRENHRVVLREAVHRKVASATAQ